MQLSHSGKTAHSTGSTGIVRQTHQKSINQTTATFSPIPKPNQRCLHVLIQLPEQKQVACVLAADIALMVDRTKCHYRGKRWGAEMDLTKRTVVEGSTAMPPVLTDLITRMQQIPLLQHFQPNEANAVDYQTGLAHWLKPHVDDRSATVSLMIFS